jgi:hypothetical protein
VADIDVKGINFSPRVSDIPRGAMTQPSGSRPRTMRHASTSGYAMAALLVGFSVMSIMLGAALPVWQTAITREREAELIFRGEQYAQAISLCQGRFAGTFLPSIDRPRKAANAGVCLGAGVGRYSFTV